MWVLKIISGKYQGNDVNLPENSTTVIGRSNGCELVLVEDMVSRQHAKVHVRDGRVFLEDLRSTNGCFVNGVRISDEVPLSEGDRILLGTSILKLIERDGSSASAQTGSMQAPAPGDGPKARPTIAHTALGAGQPEDGPSATKGTSSTMPPQAGFSSVDSGFGMSAPTSPSESAPTSITQTPAAPSPSGLSGAAVVPSSGAQSGGVSNSNPKTLLAGGFVGSIAELPLVDLLQVFGSSRRNGRLDLELYKNDERERGAVMWLRDGYIVFAEIEGQEGLDPERAAYRILRWTDGYYSFNSQVEIPTFETEIEDTTEGIIMEAMRILDEITHLGDEVPPLDATLTIKRPLEARLSELSPEELDGLQYVINYGHVESILNACEEGDVEMLRRLSSLVRSQVVEPLG